MAKLGEMLAQDEFEMIWAKYCGFLDLNLKEFMQIQERLLMEQIELISNCKLGQKIMGEGFKPANINEFREKVPLTTYEDYADTLLNQRVEELPSKPLYWIKTTWKGGTHEIKTAPYSESMIEEHTKAFIASLILSTSKKRGDFLLREDDKFLYGMAPLPYLTGLAPYGVKNEINFEYLPPIKEAENLSFEQRNRVGFELAKNKGIDLFFGLSSVLVKIGEDFAKGSKASKHSFRPTNFKMMYRIISAFFKSKIKKEPILPKDLWDIKGILCAGTDSHAFKDKIEYFWGKRPLEIYGGTEIATVATETWGDGGMTFFPDVNFLEFIPEKDSLKNAEDKNFIPKTILIDEIKPNERYELVITKFRGGAFIRYRVGDIIECLSLENKENNIKLPQVRFVDRISNIIDLAGFTRITKATIENAIELGKLPIKEWAACKEFENNEPILHMYIEQEAENEKAINIKEDLHKSLHKFDLDYKSVETLLGRDPLRVTILQPGTFDAYAKNNGSPIMKMNPNRDSIAALVGYSRI